MITISSNTIKRIYNVCPVESSKHLVGSVDFNSMLVRIFLFRRLRFFKICSSYHRYIPAVRTVAALPENELLWLIVSVVVEPVQASVDHDSVQPSRY